MKVKSIPLKKVNVMRSSLKSRTLGSWIIGKDKIHKIKYIIGINTGANNADVAAYEVSYEQAESSEKQIVVEHDMRLSRFQNVTPH